MTRKSPFVLTLALGLPLALATTLCAQPANAQTSPEDECAKLSDPADEIICLRAALSAARQAQGPADATPGTRSAPVPAPTQASPARQPSELGTEQLARSPDQPRQRDKPDDGVSTAVSDFRTDRYGNLIMQLENGEIWRQVENVDLPIRLAEGEQPDIRLTRSGFGGYRMTFIDMNRTISVSRLR